MKDRFGLTFYNFLGFGLLVYGLCCTSCAGSSTSGRNSKKNLAKFFSSSSVFNQHFTGFALYDPSRRETIFETNSSKYFTPASNTKLLTILTALSTFADTLPSMRYAIKGDRIYVRGLGDPTFLHELWPDHQALKFLKNTPYNIFLVADVLKDDLYGPGWAWDDYIEDYQAERSTFPMYGNLVHFDSTGNTYKVTPSFFQSSWSWSPVQEPVYPVSRHLTSNQFIVHDNKIKPFYIPFHTDPGILKDMLEDTLAKKVNLIWPQDLEKELEWTTLYGVAADSVYAHILKISDNFLAEQVLILTEAFVADTFSGKAAIDRAILKYFTDVPDKLQWYDGSGLSRYNLCTPRTLIYTLDKILTQIGIERVKKIFPTGGESGTISRSYGGSPSYVFAKTGSLKNNHALSGYVQTRKKKILIFSFMHANYTGSVIPIRQEMQRTLEWIRDNY